MDLIPQEILEHYREKDIDEKMFYQIKNPMRGKRAKTHSQDATEGKLFVTFLATLIRSELHNKLRKYLQSKSLSLENAIDKLNNIILVFGSSGYRFEKAFTKEQREILKELGMYDDIVKSVKNMNAQ